MDMTVVRRRLEERERLLSPYAARSFESRGREAPEEPSPVRTEFQRDRDRIIHSKAFRRLKHKTQVFIAPVGDHFVTRLTHTLEVAQIARTVARALNLNEDLTEAAALGHDLGHPPFGHAGEQALSDELRSLRELRWNKEQGTRNTRAAPPAEGFRHAEQSLRVVETLERLNLTWEVRDAIVNSSKVREDILAEGYGTPATLEGQIVKLADAVTYLNHDIGDAIRAGLISEEELPREVTQTLGSSHSQRINTLVTDIVEHSWAAAGDPSASSGQAPSTGSGRAGPPEIGMSEEVLAAANTLREFMFQRVYLWEGRRQEAERAKQVVRFLFQHYLAHPQEMESDFVIASDPPWRQAADYVAGMTDGFALSAAERLGHGV
ncbi:MAG: deoxyguanosinetriphosphate triphosphohydrolase [Dehalococcoidia bacterium]|nr:MAG: deoxyguanosinetriphosphate triphosphohydrolase [Dehalococcoidia bacterium]